METIHHFLSINAQSKADDEAFTYIDDSGEKSQINFKELHEKAHTIAQYLAIECKPGIRVVLLFPPGLEYIQAFLGCLYAGIVAVPLYPPQNKKHAGRVLTVIDDCEASLVLTNDALKQQLEAELAPLPVIGFDQLTASNSVSLRKPPTADQIAFLQYTSGSTGIPKGVVVSHGNIIANLKTLQQATHCSHQDVFCNWLPLFHDLGLINTLLLPVFLGAHSVLMSPVRFIKSPLAWLKAITEYKASICGAPNFAFDHCLERIRPHQLSGIDLSTWRIAFNAAEPVDADTLMRFSDRFSRVGFKESALFPAYGMAEATVFICGGDHEMAYTAHPFSSETLQKGQAKLPGDSEKQQILIAHGHVQAKHHLKIVSPKILQELPEGQVGEIWFSGPSVACGYWNDTEKTKACFGARLENDQNRYLRTGDLGFIYQGELYISGRIKDVLIIKGRNYYPQDFEKLAYAAYTGLNQNGAAAFEVNGNAVLLLELSRDMQQEKFDYKLACESIQTTIFEQFEVLLEDIVFLKAGRLNRTSSGKIQRSLTKNRYLSDDLDCLYSFIKGQSAKDDPHQSDQVTVTDPVSELETELCTLWEEVFDLERIGVEDNFLNLGGHSLLAATLISQIQKKWNVEISIRNFFTANTIRKLAKVIENSSTCQLSEIQPVTFSDPLLPSFAQERLWLVQQIESVHAQYNLSFSLKFYGELNEAFLLNAFKTILMRHQILRTTYGEEDGQVFQKIQESFQFDIPIINLVELTKTDQEQRVAELTQEEATKLFDLSQDLMLRVKLLKLNPQSHIMLITLHHIAADGWSMGILSKELNALYSAYVHGLENPLPPLKIQYIDFVYWQRDWLKENVLQYHLNYWKDHLRNLPVIHSLPLDHPRPPVQSYRGASVYHNLSQELQENLHNLARKNDATLFMLLNAAFACLLSRYSGESDIVIGSPIANREQAELAPLIGFFINTLVFRLDLSADPYFLDLLQQSKECTFAAYEHQQTPFEKLVDELQPERNLSHSPLFQIMLILQNQEMEALNLPGLDVKRLQPEKTIAQYDLTLTFNESENGLYMEWEFATDLFSRSTIERMIEHFEVLLQGIIKSPETQISQLSLINDEESTQLLKIWNDTASDYPQDKCIHELFEEQVERNPTAVAADFNKEELTYAELNQQANQLAHYLVNQGVTPDSLVGICVERSLDMLIGVLAIMKSGGAYLPLDPSYPKARIEYMIKDSGVQWVVTQKDLIEHCSVDQLIYLDDENFCDELKQLNQSNLDKDSLGLTSNHLAYLIYTSGSTGKPKGVMLEHHNLTNFLTSMRVEPGMTKEDTLLAVTSLSFDIHALELYLPLIVGGRVVIASSENVLSPDALELLIEEYQVTSMQATPATWKMLVNNDWEPQRKLKVLCGGEALSCNLKDELLQREAIELWNMYGPTETAVWSATQRIEDIISLGAPIANTQFYVLDSYLNPVPIGVTGELHIGGEGVARGYLNQAKLTDEKFIPNIFSDAPNAFLYKTGDLVRWLPDGTLEYLRRIDLQVKIRGHRIELEEIEARLKQHSDVKDSVAHVWTEGESSNIVAYITGKSPDIEKGIQQKLSDYLETFLPGYMLPNAYVCLQEIPLTPNGKINRNALPKPEFNDGSGEVLPETETEKKLCQMWQQLLNLEIDEGKWISVTSNFFHLGGHSLLAARLVSQIQKQWNVEVPIRTLFTEQTVRNLANVIDHGSISQIPEIVPVSTSESVPLSFAQQRLWLIDQIEQGRHQYNLCRGFQLSGKLDVAALTFAFQTIVERHQVLRTTFQETGPGNNIQVVSPDFDIEIPLLDLTGFTGEKHEQAAHQYMKEESTRVFDLTRDLMIRVKLLKFHSDSHVLLVTVHHIALDGWSEGIIINELSTLYYSKINVLPDLEIQYTDYSYWQNNYLQGDVLDPHLQFWKERLKGMPEVHNLPLDYPRPALQSYEGFNYKQVLSIDIQQGLNAIARKYDATLFMVLNAAFAVLLSRHSNEDDIVVGTPIANREQVILAQMVGFFVNTLVLRTNLSNNPSFEDVLKNCKEYLLETYEHQQLPFEKLIEELQPERSLNVSPLFQVMIVMQNNEQGKFKLPGLSIKELELKSTIARYDLTLSITENLPYQEVMEDGVNGLTLSWEYSTALFDASTIERMAGHFEVLLKGIIDNPKTKIGQIPILTPSEEQQILKWNATEADYLKNQCIHELFEERVMSHPDDVAVVFENDCLNYRELNSKANQLAYYLVEQGVKPDTLVGLCVERSLEMVIGILGIIKAGGAYVPLDPSLPADRLNYMLKDSGAEILLTQEQLLKIFSPEQQTIACLDKFEKFENYAKENINKASIGLEPHNLAYVIYTSGSTGKPKGVESIHQGLMNRLDWMHSQYQLKSEDRVLQKTPYSFDVSVWEFFWTLAYGAQLIVSKPEGHKDPGYLRDLIQRQKVSILHFVPSMLANMLTAVDFSDLSSVRCVFCSGEALPKKLVDDFNSVKSPNTRLFNLYGPTEASIDVTHWTCEENNQLNIIPIGRPINNIQLYVLNKELTPVPVGVAGELHIGGDGLARGYLNQPNLTDEKFIPNPFSNVPNARLYRTGDLVRWLPDIEGLSGNLEYIGRIDHQVKIRGFRIELGEIESILLEHKNVSEAIVIARDDDADETKNLVAYIVVKEHPLAEGASISHEKDDAEYDNVEFTAFINTLRIYLKQSLPDYMIPTAFVVLDQFPITSNGKVNRIALPKPNIQAQLSSQFIAPATDIEKQLSKIWQTLLKIKGSDDSGPEHSHQQNPIGINDNFFDLGGHSLLAVRLASEIRSRFQVEISVSAIFKQPTIGELALLIKNAEFNHVPILGKAPNDEPISLSFAQQSLWLIDQINPNQTQYNIPMALQLEGKLDIKALTSAFQSIIERHQILRTTLQLSDSGDVVQTVQREFKFSIPLFDLTDLNEGSQIKAVHKYTEEEASIPFDLSSDLMLRVQLLKRSQFSHVILVTMHHIASDGWSQGILLNEFNVLYRSFTGDKTYILPDLPIQYADYAYWQRNWLQGDVLEQNLTFWRERLQGLPKVHNLPLDHSRSVIQDYKGSTYYQTLSSDIQQSLNTLARKYDVTLFMVLSSAFSVLLSRYSGETDIVFGTPVANRDQVELTSLVGFFTNALVIRTDLSDNPYFIELLQRSKEHLLGAYEHQKLPFEKLVDELQQERNLSYSPLYQVKLALQNNELVEIDLPNLSFKKIQQSNSVALHDLSLDIYEVKKEGCAKGLELNWEYASTLFDASTIKRLAKHFEVLLKSIIEKPQARISDLPCITTVEKEQFLKWSKWPSQNDDSAALNLAAEKNISVLDLFEEQVANNPNNIAVLLNESTHSNERLTYQELNAKANQVAHYLVEQDVKPDKLVGLCVERSLEMIIGIWGILKAGAAYVPIDPNYPEKHIEHILDDSAIEIVLTTSELLSELPFDELQILPLDDELWEGFLGDYSLENINRQKLELSLNDLAYVIYTSGSTGLPKGVTVEHRGLIQSTLSRFDVYQESPCSFALFSSFAFDSSIVGIFWTLVSGGKLCIVDIKQGVDVTLFQSLMTEEQVSHFLTLPSVYQAMLSSGIQPGPSLKTIIVAGEVCDQSLVKQHQSHEQWKHCRLFNEYGPTEACVWSSYYDCTYHSGGVVPIGATVPHAELFVLDNELQHCPLGVTGELYIGGENLARGYLNDSELTNQKFISSPFHDDQRLYKTGDLVRCMPDQDGLPGNLEFIGRRDHQIKIRGFRIELREIEAAIAEYEHVSEAIVLAKTIVSSQNSKQLVAYVVPDKINSETNYNEFDFREALQTYLKKSLLNHKIPTVFVILEKLPLTPNGKIDREALQAKEVPSQLIHQYVAPKTEIEKQLCEIWQSLLKVKKIGITENFFAIGGDSILAIQAVARAAKKGFVFTTRQLFEFQTIEKLASQVTSEAKVSISQNNITGEHPLITIQREFVSNDLVGQQHNHQSVVLMLPKDFSLDALHKIVIALYQRHDVLRLSVSGDKATYIPLTDQLADRAIVCRDLKQLQGEASESAFIDLVKEIKAGLSLTDADVLRAVLCDENCEGKEDHHRLLLTLHQSVVDSVSWYLLLQDLAIGFEQWKQKQPIQLSPKSSSFQQWGQFLEKYSFSDALQQEKIYWLTLADVAVNPLPVDHNSAEENLKMVPQQVLIQLTEFETQTLLNDCASAYRTQLNDLLLSALYLALHNWTNDTAFRIDLEIDGRETFNEELNLTQTIGRFASVCPMMLNVEPGASINVIIKTVKEQLRSIPANGIGFGLLRNVVKNDAICRAYPRGYSEIVFNYLGQFDQPVNIVRADMNSLSQRGQTLKLNGIVINGHLEFSLNYDGTQYNKQTMEYLASGLESALREIMNHCQSEGTGGVTPSDFPLADVTQTQLDEWYETYHNFEKIYPTTGMQQGMLYHSSLDASAYISQLSVKLAGKLDSFAFKLALNGIVRRYDVFRTVFIDDYTHQLVLSETNLDFTELNWTEYNESEQQQQLGQFLKQDKAQGFDFKKGSLMRITLVELSEEQHCLIWSSHHALSDGWSFPLVFKEVITLYVEASHDSKGQLSASQLSSVLPEAQPYESYIAWLQQQDDEKAKSYWRELLASFETPTHINVDRIANDQSQGAKKQWLNLTHETSAQLQSLARHHQVTLNTLVQAAWAYLLHRYSGEKQLVFGETISGRPAEIKGVEQMVGLFINSLPVMVNIGPEQEIGTWLRTLHQASIDRVENGFLSLSEIQNLSPVSNSEGRERNLFDTLVVFENFPIDQEIEKAVVGSDLSVTEIKIFEQTNYGLTLSVLPENTDLHSKLSFKLGYHAERFEEGAIARILAHFELILKGLLDETHKTLGELPILTADEERKLLIDWNDTTSDYPHDKCIHQLFIEQVTINPDKIALVYQHEALSYQQLYDKSHDLALYLQSLGVQADSLVGLCVERSLEMMVGILGVLLAGGAYVPLDPDYPDERLSFMLQDSEAAIVLSQEKLKNKLSTLVSQDTQLITLDKQWSVISGCADDLKTKKINLCHEVKPNNLAYVIYTSGSTGQPKGVMIEHRMVVDYCYSVFKKMALHHCETFAAVSTFSADLGNIALFVPIMFSKRIYLFSNQYANHPVRLKEYFDNHPIDCMKITPSHFEMFKISDTEIVTSSKVLIFAGEPLTKGIVETVNTLKPNCRVFNNYGPTETTISKLSTSELNCGELSNIYLGKPLDNTQVYILDQYNKPQPIGVPGELHIGGDGVARGYLNRPELTKEKFIPNPYNRGTRMYKTGDLVRWLDDGNIEYLGRIDNQVKIRGFRIEVGEIETQLNQHPEIKDSVVVVQGQESEKQLIAFYVPVITEKDRPEESNNFDEDLREHLLQTLPEYMLPVAFVRLETIPLTPNGKIDRRALERMDVSLESSQDYLAPRNETEEKLVELWAEVLELEPEHIGVNDNFFELGGHSLKATRLISKISHRLAIDLPLAALFNLPTIAGMSAFIYATHYQPEAPTPDDETDQIELEEGTL